MWQETVIETGDFIKRDSIANGIGAALIPAVNYIGNWLTNYDREAIFQLSLFVYPGAFFCNTRYPHAKWHEISANAFVDLFYLMDDVKRVLSGKTLASLSPMDDFSLCFVENDCFTDFDMDVLPDFSEDSLMLALSDCLPEVIYSWPNVDVDSLGNCLVKSSKSISGGIKSVDSMDSCLFENNCILFRAGVIDIPNVRKCVETKCGSFIKEKSVYSCLDDCSGTMCAAECLRLSSNFSVSANVATSCFSALLSDQHDPRIDSACKSGGDTTPSTTIQFFVKGLPKVVECSRQSCSTQYKQWNTERQNIWTCTSACMETPGDTLDFLPLPDFLRCGLACFAESFV